MNCKYPPNCPKGLSRKQLIEIARQCNIPGHTNQYKSPYRNMNWLCQQISLIASQVPEAPQVKPVIKIKKITGKQAKKVVSVPVPLESEILQQIPPSEREKIMEEYKKHWVQEFGIDPDLPEFKKLGRERYIKKKYGGREGLMEARRLEFEEEMAPKISERAAKKIQKGLRQELLCQPCENLTAEQQAYMDPLQLIRLMVTKDGKSHCMCYDVQLLYEQLKETYGTTDAGIKKWTDPVHGVLYSTNQAKRIRRSWALSRPDSPARIQFEGQLALYRK